MSAFLILPTRSGLSYRGKRPTFPRSISAGETGLHVELFNGLRLWAAPGAVRELPKLDSDFAEIAAAAVPMTAEQYAELRRAAELLRDRVNIAGHGKRAELESRVRAMAAAIPAMPEREAAARSESCLILSEGETLAERAGGIAVETAAGDNGASLSPVRVNLRRQAEGMAEIARAEQRAAIAETVETIDMTPTWAGILPALRALIENSNAEGRRTAWAELGRMAALADERNRLSGELARYESVELARSVAELEGGDTADVIQAYAMRGDGCQAAGAIVLRKLPGNDVTPYVVHFRNDADSEREGRPVYYFGDYCRTLPEAWAAFADKVRRFDPTGALGAETVSGEAR